MIDHGYDEPIDTVVIENLKKLNRPATKMLVENLTINVVCYVHVPVRWLPIADGRTSPPLPHQCPLASVTPANPRLTLRLTYTTVTS